MKDCKKPKSDHKYTIDNDLFGENYIWEPSFYTNKFVYAYIFVTDLNKYESHLRQVKKYIDYLVKVEKCKDTKINNTIKILIGNKYD